tara:strand:- start:592 stop:702 length:111 start_codon:yes stop_codon:yes gene_type:complete
MFLIGSQKNINYILQNDKVKKVILAHLTDKNARLLE